MKYFIVLLTIFLITACDNAETPPTDTGGTITGSGDSGATGSTTSGATTGSDSGGTTASTSSGSTTSGSTTGTPPPPPPPPPPTGQFPVFPGCESVDIKTYAFKRDLYVDPVSGSDTNSGLTPQLAFKTLADGSASSRKLKGGDHVHFMAGNHVAMKLSKGPLPLLATNKDWIWLDFKPGSVIPKITMSGVSHFVITGASVNVTAGDAVDFSGDNLILSGANVYGNRPVDAKGWIALTTQGFYSRDGACVTVLNSSFKILRQGMTVYKNLPAYPANSMKVLFADNIIEEASYDFTRAIGSDVIIKNNKVTGGYIGPAQGDPGHDDLFQGFAIGGPVFENITIEGNTFIDKSPLNQFSADYQGISVFDGLYKHMIIRKNIVVGGAFHGISISWGDDILIENNTVVSSYYDASGNLGTRNFWVGVFKGKGGQLPTNIRIRNNLASQFAGTTQITENVNNLVVKHTDYVAFDPKTATYDFNLKPTSAAFGKGAGAL